MHDDSFLIPSIDKLVDAFSIYNQISMALKYQDKTTFIMEEGLFCYRVMPFGLKNTGTTYQRLLNNIFIEQIGRSVEVYIDDMLVKSSTLRGHIQNFSKAFTILQAQNMMFTFGVRAEKFLGFMVSERDIEVSPEKIQAILDMSLSNTIKDIQHLTGRVVALTSSSLG